MELSNNLNMDNVKNNRKYQYFAFISYKREDEKWAKWLQNKLEYYKVPVSIRKTNPSLPNRIRPIFKDTTDLEPGFLNEKIRNALDASKYLIVVCSPLSSKSAWVNNEVKSFIDRGDEARIIPFIIGGCPNSHNTDEECFPESLRQLSGSKEILGVNINEMGREAAFLKVISFMLGIRFDMLWQRYEKAKRKRLAGLVALAILAAATAITMGSLYSTAERERQRADREAIRANNEAKRANMEAQKALEEARRTNLAEDSVKSQNSIIELTMDRLKLAFADLKIKNDSLLSLNHNLIISQIKSNSTFIKSNIENNNLYGALDWIKKTLLIYNTLPNQTYIPELEAALREYENGVKTHFTYTDTLSKSNFDNFKFGEKYAYRLFTTKQKNTHYLKKYGKNNISDPIIPNFYGLILAYGNNDGVVVKEYKDSIIRYFDIEKNVSYDLMHAKKNFDEIKYALLPDKNLIIIPEDNKLNVFRIDSGKIFYSSIDKRTLDLISYNQIRYWNGLLFFFSYDCCVIWDERLHRILSKVYFKNKNKKGVLYQFHFVDYFPESEKFYLIKKNKRYPRPEENGVIYDLDFKKKQLYDKNKKDYYEYFFNLDSMEYEKSIFKNDSLKERIEYKFYHANSKPGKNVNLKEFISSDRNFHLRMVETFVEEFSMSEDYRYLFIKNENKSWDLWDMEEFNPIFTNYFVGAQDVGFINNFNSFKIENRSNIFIADLMLSSDNKLNLKKNKLLSPDGSITVTQDKYNNVFLTTLETDETITLLQNKPKIKVQDISQDNRFLVFTQTCENIGSDNDSFEIVYMDLKLGKQKSYMFQTVNPEHKSLDYINCRLSKDGKNILVKSPIANFKNSLILENPIDYKNEQLTYIDTETGQIIPKELPRISRCNFYEWYQTIALDPVETGFLFPSYIPAWGYDDISYCYPKDEYYEIPSYFLPSLTPLSANFNSTGQKFIAGYSNGDIYLWDRNSIDGQPLLIASNSGEVISVDIDPNEEYGMAVIKNSAKKPYEYSIKIWHLDSKQLIDIINFNQEIEEARFRINDIPGIIINRSCLIPIQSFKSLLNKYRADQ